MKASWQFAQSFSSFAWPSTSGPGMTSFSKMFCAVAVSIAAQMKSATTAARRRKDPGNAASRSIKMDSDHMQDRRQNQEKEKRHVQDMPEREHAFVHSEPCCLVDGGEIEVEMLSYELQSFPAGAPAEPACLSLTPNGLFHLPQNALADVIGAPAKHQKGPDA